MRGRGCLAELAAALALAHPAAAASDQVLICYLWQSGGGGMPTQFIRRLEIDSKDKRVAIADDTGAGFRPLGYYGRLVSADESGISFDFASPQSSGRATVDLRNGAFRYGDGRMVITGNCAPSQT